jgi:hypothetical protein
MVLLLVFVMFLGSPSASLIGSYVHDYGNGEGKFDPGGNDVLYGNYVQVSDKSSSRFSDFFTFNDLSYSTIEKFELTLEFSNISIWPIEDWYMRPDGTLNYWSFNLNTVGSTPTTQTFSIDISFQPEFNDMVTAKKFEFWFAEETGNFLHTDIFNLYSAKLDIFGQAIIESHPTPEPATMLLFGVGLLGIAGVSRRRKQTHIKKNI